MKQNEPSKGRVRLTRRLIELQQEHLIADLDRWDDEAIQKCIRQIARFTPDFVAEQRKSWMHRLSPLSLTPLMECPTVDDVRPSEGRKTAVVILAGGQGSRLGMKGPKGCFPLLGKSLFERLCEKMVQEKGRVAIMTSPLNHEETVNFFKEHRYFGLKEVLFFSQETVPLLDEHGRWFWEEAGRIAEGPDGNGSVFRGLEVAGILDRFEQEKIEVVHIVPVDNPLAEPFDPALSQFHAQELADLTVKCIYLENPDEAMGRLVWDEEGHLTIAEFAELSFSQRKLARLANTGLLAINLSLMRKLAKIDFPLHWAYRSSTKWEKGETLTRQVWKGERFIVDALLFAEHPKALCYPRFSCFAPLKEKKSIAAIEELLQEREKENLNKTF